MEFLIEHFSSIFCYFTGALIVWSLYLGYEHHKIISAEKIMFNHPHRVDIIQMIGLFAVSLFLTSSLLAFPNALINFLDVIFILELWYTVFLSHVSANVYKSLQYINKIEKPSQITKEMGHTI
jgi:hypothetical protein